MPMKAEDLPELVVAEHKKLGSHPSTDAVIRIVGFGFFHIKDIRVNYDTKQIEIVAKK